MEKVYRFTFDRFWRSSRGDIARGLFLFLFPLILNKWHFHIALVFIVMIFFFIPLLFMVNYIYTAIGIRFIVQKDNGVMVYQHKWRRKSIEFSEKDIKNAVCSSNANGSQYQVSDKYFYYKITLKSGEQMILNSYVVDDSVALFRQTEFKNVEFPFIF